MKKYSIYNILLFSFIIIAFVIFISGVRELLELEQLKTLKATTKVITEKEALLKETLEFVESEKLILHGIINTTSEKEFNLLVSNHDATLNLAKNNLKNISFIDKKYFDNIEDATEINIIFNETKNEFFGKYLPNYSKIIETKEQLLDFDSYFIEKFDEGSKISKEDLHKKLKLNLSDIHKQANHHLNNIQSKLVLVDTKIKLISEKLNKETNDKLSKSQNLALVFIAGVIIALFIVLSYLIRFLIKPIGQLQSHLNIITEGELPDPIKVESGKEINNIAETVNNLVSGLKRGVKFSNEIGKGNFDAEYELLGENDELGSSLLTLRQDLLLAQDEEKKRKEEDAQRNRTNEGLAMFNDIMKQQSGSLSELADRIISSLVKFTNSNQGALFLLNEDDKDDVYYELLGAYAYNKKKYISKHVKLGEGLVGAVAIEKYTMYMTDVPDEYIEIESGVGSANPRSILIVPLKVEEDVLGIIELASFNKFEPYEIEMIEKIADTIASSLANVKINLQTKSLIEYSKEQEELVQMLEKEIQQYNQQIKDLQKENLQLQSENKKLKQITNLTD
ncbi:MAG: GAF domain-containing protein [Chlorobi bacterium]|nr:GAF domain-containing protein [Chlorobiota bacterium]